MQYTKPMNETDPDAHYVDANPSLGIEGSIVPAAAIEPSMREIVNVITEAGLTPSGEDLTQLAQAVKTLGMREATNQEIGGGYLAESIKDTRDLAFTNAKTVYAAINNAAGANSIPTYYPGEFKDFFEEEAPEGWAVRDGAVLENADENYPELWLELQKPENAFKLKTLSQWNALSSAAGGVGGVPYFVLDTSAKTIKLPDTRTDFFRDANDNVGAWQGDAIRNITGTTTSPCIEDTAANTGAIYQYGWQDGKDFVNQGGNWGLGFDASRVVPTAEENRPRNISLLGCVCIEPAKAQRNEATTTTPGAVYLAANANDRRSNAVTNVELATGVSMPSYSKFMLITAGVSGSEYTAPANGFFVVRAISTLSNAQLWLRNNTNGLASYSSVALIDQQLAVYVPVKVGSTITLFYTNANINDFRFIYARGDSEE